MEQIKKLKQLITQCNQYRNEYYNLNSPSVSDVEYDKLFDEISQLEKETGCIFSNSPTQQVGYKVVSKLQKIQHSIPLLSLNKTKIMSEIEKFIGDNASLIMLKLDGLTVELEYDNGKLQKGSTRGDGYEGEDITHNISAFKNVPLEIDYKGYLKIVGEAIIYINDFDMINSQLPEEEKYKTPRNLVAGSVRQLDSEVCAKRCVYFIPFEVIEGLDDIINNYSKTYKLSALFHLGFDRCESCTISGNNDPDFLRLEEIFDYFRNKANGNYIPIDGIVVKYDDISYSNSVGETSHHKNDGIAFKFEDEVIETIFRGIELNPTRTGMISLTALFDEVEIDGTSVSRASVHNIDIFESFEFGVGDNITVYKANMIIPQIASNLTKSRTYQLPMDCPCCGYKMAIEAPKDARFLFCSNPDCPAKLLQRFVHFVSKPAMNIEGLSEATLEKFISKGWLKKFVDIYALKYKTEIANMDGFGQKSFENLRDAIEKSEHVKMENFLVAMGIPNVGKTASKTISKYFKGDWFAFEKAILDGFDFTTLEDFGYIMHESIYHWYNNFKERVMWDSMTVMLDFIKPENTIATSNPFVGKTIVVTGTLNNFTRDSIQEKIESLGAKAGSSVSSKTDYVLVGDKAGSKLTKAQELGVKVIIEDQFLRMISN
jgi:DNA ligase (NAD+)